MELDKKNQNLHVLKASTIRHSDIQDLPVDCREYEKVIYFSVSEDNMDVRVVVGSGTGQMKFSEEDLE